MTTTPATAPTAIEAAIILVLKKKQPLTAKVIADGAHYPMEDVYYALDGNPTLFARAGVVERHSSTPGRHFAGDGDSVEQDTWKLATVVPPTPAAASPLGPPPGTPTPGPTMPAG